MIRVFYDAHCITCRKVFMWMRDNDLQYEKVNITKDLTLELILDVLEHTENGLEDIISTKSKYMKENDLNLDDMNTNEVIQLILEHPTILRRPIITSDIIMQIGYNAEEITAFLPKEKRTYHTPGHN